MHQLELLNVLDVLKNEEKYTERLAELKKLEQSILDKEYIQTTMTQADRLRNEYADLKKEAEEALQNIAQEVEDQVKSERERLKAMAKQQQEERYQLSKEEDRLANLQIIIADQQKANQQTKTALDAERKRLSDWSVELNQRERLVNKKCSLIRQAYELRE